MARSYRFFVNDVGLSSVAADGTFWLTEKDEEDAFYQLKTVLRAKIDDSVVLLNGDGNEYSFKIINLDKKGIELRFLDKSANLNELDFDLELLLCVPNKPDKLELILQKSVEIGVKTIKLVNGEFSQMKHNLRLDRIEKILKEAAEQSERAEVPKIEVLSGNLVNFLKGCDRSMLENSYVALERIDGKVQVKYDSNVTVLVGPEGGFSEAEKSLFAELKLKTFSLGKRVLRMETAAIVALGLASMKSL